MGVAISGMHYTGMAAMRGPDGILCGLKGAAIELSYDRLWVALSVIIAIAFATAALWLTYRTTEAGQKLAAAMVMGLAISGCTSPGCGPPSSPLTPRCRSRTRTGKLDRNFPLALAIAGFTLSDLAALFASVSKRKRADEALRQTQADLAHIQRVTTMGELAASISHEVMQPLGAVVTTNAQTALRWLGGQPPNLDEVRQALGRAVKDGRRAAEIVGPHAVASSRRSPCGRMPWRSTKRSLRSLP